MVPVTFSRPGSIYPGGTCRATRDRTPDPIAMTRNPRWLGSPFRSHARGLAVTAPGPACASREGERRVKLACPEKFGVGSTMEERRSRSLTFRRMGACARRDRQGEESDERSARRRTIRRRGTGTGRFVGCARGSPSWRRQEKAASEASRETTLNLKCQRRLRAIHVGDVVRDRSQFVGRIIARRPRRAGLSRPGCREAQRWDSEHFLHRKDRFRTCPPHRGNDGTCSDDSSSCADVGARRTSLAGVGLTGPVGRSLDRT
jgi:hypothetical protein